MTAAGPRDPEAPKSRRRARATGKSPVPRQRASRKKPVAQPATPAPSPGWPAREQMIAEAAYYRAEQRNFAPGREMEDWLAAELEIDSLRPERPESIDEAEIIGPIP